MTKIAGIGIALGVLGLLAACDHREYPSAGMGSGMMMDGSDQMMTEEGSNSAGDAGMGTGSSAGQPGTGPSDAQQGGSGTPST